MLYLSIGQNHCQNYLFLYYSPQTKEMRVIKHFLFLSWPDYGVPPDASGLLKFLFHVRKAQAQVAKESGWKVNT